MADFRSEAKQLNTSTFWCKKMYLEKKEDTLEGHRVGLQRFPLANIQKE